MEENTGTGTSEVAEPVLDVVGAGLDDRLAALRGELLEMLDTAATDLDRLTTAVSAAKQKVGQVAGVALDAGIDVEEIAAKLKVSTGTVRKWAAGNAGR